MFYQLSHTDRAVNKHVTTTREAIPGTNSVDVDTFLDNVNDGPDLISDKPLSQDQEPQHDTRVVIVPEEEGSSDCGGRKGMAGNGNKNG